jgi:hypothetical protein
LSDLRHRLTEPTEPVFPERPRPPATSLAGDEPGILLPPATLLAVDDVVVEDSTGNYRGVWARVSPGREPGVPARKR